MKGIIAFLVSILSILNSFLLLFSTVFYGSILAMIGSVSLLGFSTTCLLILVLIAKWSFNKDYFLSYLILLLSIIRILFHYLA
jgi:hypothetical protein